MGVYFGKYELLERIGSGGMAEVFRARLPSLHGLERIVAIKRILPYHCEDTSFVQMFLDEAKITLALTHPSIGQVYELNQVDGQYYIAMEFIDGPNLSTVVKKLQKLNRRIPLDFALHVTARVCEGLYAAHTQRNSEGHELSIIHRDVSPHNVMVTRQGGVKLIDFGIAKARDRLVQTVAGTVRGKLLYMSPEQAASQELDARSDLFSAGMLFLTLLCGQHIWRGLDEVEVLIAIRRWAPPSVRELRPDLSGEIADALQTILNRSLAVDPNQRYPHAEAMRVDLATLLARINPAFSPLNLGRFVDGVLEGREDVGEPDGSAERAAATSGGLSGGALADAHTAGIPLQAQAQAQARATTTHLRELRRDQPTRELPQDTPQPDPHTPSHSRPFNLPDTDDVAPTVEIDSADLNAIRHLFGDQRAPQPEESGGKLSPVLLIGAGLGALAVIGLAIAVLVLVMSQPEVGSLHITSEPAGASIELDDQLMGSKTPAQVDNVPVGEHHVTLRRGDFTWDTQVVIRAGEIEDIKGILDPGLVPEGSSAKADASSPSSVAVEPPTTGAVVEPALMTLHIYANQRGTTLRLDDAELPDRTGDEPGVNPVVLQAVEPGKKHRLEAERAGFVAEPLEFELEKLEPCSRPEGADPCREIQVRLKRVEPERPRNGTLRFIFIPAVVQVAVNGQVVCSSTPCQIARPPGSYNIVVTNPANKKSERYQIVLESGVTKPVSGQLE